MTCCTYPAPEQECKRATGAESTRADTAEMIGKLDFDGQPAHARAAGWGAGRHRRRVPGPGGRTGHRANDDIQRTRPPRYIEFLYSKTRLNVEVSRAKCLAIVIANPALTAINFKTTEQMVLVNTLCWLAEAGRLQ